MYIISFILFIDFLGFGLIVPITAVFRVLYDLNPFQIGLFAAIFFISTLVGGIIQGPLSDKVGRRPVLLFTTFGLAITYFVNAIIQLYPSTNTFYNLLLCRVALGLLSGNIPVVFAAAIDIAHRSLESRRKSMAILGSVIGLGLMLGPPISGVLAEFTSTVTMAPFYYSGVASLICFALLLFFFKETLPPVTQTNCQQYSVFYDLWAHFKDKKFLVSLTLYISFFFAFTSFEVYLLTIVLGYFLDLSQLQIGIVWSLFALFSSFFQFYCLRLAKLKKALILGFLIYAIGLMSLVLTLFALWAVLISMFICALGVGLILPNISTLVALQGTARNQGLVFSINQSFGALGRFLGPVVLGWMYDTFNTINVVWIFIGLLMLLQVFISVKAVSTH